MCNRSVFGPALLSLLLHSPNVLLPILRVGHVRVGLGRAFLIRVAHQVLDAQQDLWDCQRRPPVLVLVQDRQADGARRVYIRVEEDGDEFTLGRLVGVVLREL